MIDLYETACRICLEDGAMYPIFDNTEEFERVYGKLAVCLQEKLEDLEGYPRNICIKCKNTSETICKFIATFQKTCEILQNSVVQVKTENLQDYIDVNDDEVNPFIYELQVYEPSVKLKSKNMDPAELLESLTHLTVKRIKVEDSLDSEETCNEYYLKRKRGQSKKADNKKVKEIAEDNLLKANTVTKKGRAKTTTYRAKTTTCRAKTKTCRSKTTTCRSKTTTCRSKTTGRAVTTASSKQANKSRVKPAVTKKTVTKPAAKNNRASKQCSTDISNPGIEKNNVDRSTHLKKQSIKKKHQKNKATKNLSCDLCGITYETADLLSKHKSTKHRERNYKCAQCPKTYLTERHLKLHVMRTHEKVKTAICDYCGMSTFAKYQLTAHINAVHLNKKKKPNIFKCKFCEKTFKYKNGAIIHERAVHTGERPAKCHVCSSKFFHETYLKEHMRLHTGDLPFKCPVCARAYAQRGNMKTHMRKHRISELDPDTRAKINPNYLKFLRPSVDLGGKQDYNVKANRTVPVLCDLCGATFPEKTYYYNHIKTKHRERKFKCTKCPKDYISKNDLNIHIKMHDNIRDYICDACGKGFYRRRGLVIHIKQVHWKQREKRHKCKFCDKTFSSKKIAVVHERSLHTGERPEICEVCGASFSDRAYLREHVRLHTGETPYKCPVCARGYAQRGNMKSHMRNHRISELDPETLTKIKPSHLKFLKP